MTLTADEQLEAYQKFLEQSAEQGAKSARGGGGGFLPFLKLDPDDKLRVRFVTGQLLSPRIKLHEKRKGKELVWTGKCMHNWLGVAPCAGCLEAAAIKESGNNDYTIKTVDKVVPLLYDYAAEGQMRTIDDGRQFPENVLKKFPRSVTQTVDFYQVDKEYQVTQTDMFVTRKGSGTDTRYLYSPATAKKSVVIDGVEQLVDVVLKAPFTYTGEDKQMLAVMKAVAERDFKYLYDLVLQGESYCPGQKGLDGQPLDERAPNPPSTHLALLVAMNLIPNPMGDKEVARTGGTDAKLAPASRPRAAVGDEFE